MAVSRKADLETYVDTFVTRMRVGLAALLEAGYGEKFAAGHAAEFVGLAAKLGLLNTRTARTAAPAPKEA